MHRLAALLLALTLFGAGLAVTAPVALAGGPCTGSEVEVRGRVTDAATGLPLNEVTSVEVVGVSFKYEDGFGTDPASRYSICLAPGTYKIKFVADSYRTEWFDDEANPIDATVIDANGPGPVVANAALTPKGRVIAGRVTNMAGAPRFASIGIWRLTPGGWRSIDGIGNDMPQWHVVLPGAGPRPLPGQRLRRLPLVPVGRVREPAALRPHDRGDRRHHLHQRREHPRAVLPRHAGLLHPRRLQQLTAQRSPERYQLV